ncbi:hypothetical protein GCM10010321_08680 [Streptomyces chartreusis]|nr:hypothetical protein GCM10010321_08680 [Streptomyces chartreusis]
MLEGVGGQVDGAGAGPGVERRPVHGYAIGVEPGQCGHGGRLLVTVPPQQRYGVLHQGCEDGVGADLQEVPHTRVRERTDTVGEPHGLPGVPHPVVGRGEVGRADRRAGDGGDDIDVRLVGREPGEGGTEVVEHRIHERRMEGVADGQPRVPPLPQRRQHPLDAFLGARKHHGTGPVDRSQRHVTAQMRQYFLLGRLHGDHRAALRQRLHQPRPRRHHHTRIRQRQHTRDMRGRDLTHRVTGDVVGSDAEGFHEAIEGHLDREQGGLSHTRTLQHPRVRTPHRLPHPRRQLPQHLVKGSREHREPAVQLAPHAQPLSTLTGEQEGERTLLGLAPGHLGRRSPGGDQHRAVFEGRAGGGE